MVLTVDFVLDGQPVTAINGGPEFTFDEAISLLITCKDQAEVDHYWAALTADGGSEGPCGWLKDRYGLSWQVVPEGMDALFQDPDPTRAARAMKAVYIAGCMRVEPPSARGCTSGMALLPGLVAATGAGISSASAASRSPASA